MNIGENIKKYRKLRGMTQFNIATELGINIRTYQKYEEGTIEPHFSRLTYLAEVLEVPITDLLGLPERPIVKDLSVFSTKELLEELLRREKGEKINVITRLHV